LSYNFIYLLFFAALITGCSRDVREEANSSLEPSLSGFNVTSVAVAKSSIETTVDILGEDEWQSEARAELLQQQLEKLIGIFLTQGKVGSLQSIQLLHSNATANEIVPAKLKLSKSVNTLGVAYTVDDLSQQSAYYGADKVTEGLRLVFEEFQEPNTRFKIKVTSVNQLEPDQWETQFLIGLYGQVNNQAVEQHMSWNIQWKAVSTDYALLLSIHLESFKRFEARSNKAWFAECTPSVMKEIPAYLDQILMGTSELNRVLPNKFGLDWADLRGFGLGDANGDGLEDIYVCERPGIPNRLFIQQTNGQLIDVSKAWNVDWIDDSRSALFADFDNDGDQDLAIGLLGGIVLMENESNTHYSFQTILPASESVMHLSGSDFDLDGNLDLYVCIYNPNELLKDRISGFPIGVGIENQMYDSNFGGSNRLFRNNINSEQWDFEDLTVQSGLDQNNTRFSFAASWEDFDNDGDQDLYVANDFGRNCLYQNELNSDGTRNFTDLAAKTNSEDQASGMSVSWGDYNRDGWMDLYVANMWSSAGQRIIPQTKFNPDISKDIRSAYHRFSLGNTLLVNQGGDVFSDVTESSGVSLGRWAWASPFIDINNDGWEDLFVANGYITGHSDSGDL
jgi:hypothetical protein